MTRMSALRRSALDTGEQLGERASELFEGRQERNMLMYALVAMSGFTLGLLTGLLFAPASGYETRSRISGRASDAMTSAREMAKRRAQELSDESERIA